MNQNLFCLEIIYFIVVCVLANYISDTSGTYCTGSEWFAYKDEKCFKLIKKFSTWDEAEELCNKERLEDNSWAPRLVSIKSADEQSFLTTFIFNTSDVKVSVWIGARKLDNGDQFVWNDGSDLDFTNWSEGPSNGMGRDCVEMRSEFTKQFHNMSKLDHNILNGKWKDVTCESANYVICQKFQTWSFPQLQKNFLDARKELQDSLENVRNQLDESKEHQYNTRIELNVISVKLNITQNELNITRNELFVTRNELNVTRKELKDTKNELEGMINQRLEGVEGIFMSSFEVGGSIHFYYPVAFDIHHQLRNDRVNPRTPLIYDIFRFYAEKAPESLNDGSSHYMGLTLKLMCTDGGWSAGVNSWRVLLHNWVYNKGVANVHLFDIQESRLFVWLRGGGVLYHIRSPIDLTRKITIYLEDNAIAKPAHPGNEKKYPAVIVNPIAVGRENPNLVKTGVYDGWRF